LPVAEPANEKRARIERRESRKSAWKTALLSTAIVSLIAVCAYLANQHPEKIAELLGVTQWLSTAPAEISRDDPSALATPGTSEVPTPSGTPSTIREASVAAPPASHPGPTIDPIAVPPAAEVSDTSRTSPPAESMRVPPIESHASAAASNSQAGICSDALKAAGLCSVGVIGSQVQALGQTPDVPVSQPRGSPIDPAVRTRPSAVQAKGTVEAQQAPSNITQESRNETEPSAASQVIPGSPNRSAATSQTPVTVPRVSVCTEALAAVGLCSRSSTQESK
jgi:hypothetical protein